MKILSMQDVHDMLKGCVILGTGGGGEMSEGLEFIEEAHAAGKAFHLMEVDETPDDALIVTPYYVGAVSELPEAENKKYEGLPKATEQPIMTAVNQIEKLAGKQIYGVIACEAGGANTAVPLYVAAMKNGYLLDADIAGRAVPEVTNSTYYIQGLPIAPIVASNEFGEVAVYDNIKDDARAEDILRSLAIVSKNSIAVVDHALDMKILRNAIIPGTISKALELGRSFRKAKETGDDISHAIAAAAGGMVVFTGTITEFDWKTEAGFTVGNMYAGGTGKCAGDTLRIWFKNENLMSWLNNDVYVTLPDLICVIDTDQNEPVTNPNYHKGMNIAVVIYAAPEVFTTECGLEAFGPKRFGFDIEYTPAIGRVQAI